MKFQDIIALDAPSNAAEEKVKKRKIYRRRSNGPELGTYPVQSICKTIDYMRSIGSLTLPGGGFNPIPEHAPEEEPQFYGRDLQPAKFVSAEYKRERRERGKKDVVPVTPATMKKKKGNAKGVVP